MSTELRSRQRRRASAALLDTAVPQSGLRSTHADDVRATHAAHNLCAAGCTYFRFAAAAVWTARVASTWPGVAGQCERFFSWLAALPLTARRGVISSARRDASPRQLSSPGQERRSVVTTPLGAVEVIVASSEEAQTQTTEDHPREEGVPASPAALQALVDRRRVLQKQLNRCMAMDLQHVDPPLLGPDLKAIWKEYEAWEAAFAGPDLKAIWQEYEKWEAAQAA